MPKKITLVISRPEPESTLGLVRGEEVTDVGAQRPGQGVEPADFGVAERGALLGVAVDPADRVINIDQRQPAVIVGHQVGVLGGEPGHDPGPDRVELLDMADR